MIVETLSKRLVHGENLNCLYEVLSQISPMRSLGFTLQIALKSSGLFNCAH